MRIKIESEGNLVETEEALEKAIKRKSECSDSEQYSDDAFNKFHDMVCEKHDKLLDRIIKELETELKRGAHSSGNY